MNAIIRPIKEVDANSLFAGLKRKGHGDKKAPFKRTNLSEVASDTKRRLPMEKMSANGRRKARGHAADAVITLRDIAIDGRAAGGDKHQEASRHQKRKAYANAHSGNAKSGSMQSRVLCKIGSTSHATAEAKPK